MNEKSSSTIQHMLPTFGMFRPVTMATSQTCWGPPTGGLESESHSAHGTDAGREHAGNIVIRRHNGPVGPVGSSSTLWLCQNSY